MDWFFICFVTLLPATLIGALIFAAVADTTDRVCLGIGAGVVTFVVIGLVIGTLMYNCQKSKEEQKQERAEIRIDNHNRCIEENFSGGLDLVPMHGDAENGHYLSMIRGGLCSGGDTCIMVAYRRVNQPINYLTIPSNRVRVTENANHESNPHAEFSFREPNSTDSVGANAQSLVSGRLEQVVITCRPGQCLVQMSN